MTPLSDELRSVLAARAATVVAAPDPHAGIEHRARGMRRRRTAAGAVGAAASVALIALAVPVLTGGSGAAPARFATPAPATPPAVPPVPSVAPVSPVTSATPFLPVNVLAWPATGSAPTAAEVLDLAARYARARQRPGDAAAVRYRPLRSDTTESGVRYTVGQAWFVGSAGADDVSMVRDRTSTPVLTVWGRTPRSPAALGYVLRIATTFGTDLLVVVSRPGIGQVSYSPDATTALLPVAGGTTGQPTWALVPRAAGAHDRLEVLDGDGNLDHPAYRGPVATLLCRAACP